MNDVFTWPVGHASDGERDAWKAPRGPVLAYCGAAVIGGALSALALFAAGTGVRETLNWSTYTLALACAPIVGIALVGQIKGVIWLLPERRAQVPTRWLQWSRPAAIATAFGAMIGSGAFTHLRHAAAWTVAVLVAAAPSLMAAVAIGLCYGLFRALPLLLTWMADARALSRPAWERIGATNAPLTLALAPIAFISYLLSVIPLP
ncbi:MAG: hypothetical protein Q8O56_05695 [Solirubrobacteraceae bacterium]|nr:hypothetical protein [Solirubrobacteraceae bacterium]